MSYNTTYCPEAVVDPQMSINFTEDQPLSSPGVTDSSMIQLKPQRVAMKIRPNSPKKISVQFKQAKDYPVDLYYLMDLSYSMLDDKKMLASLGSLLGTTMGNITRNFRLGYGSFVDKKVSPFINTARVDNPCEDCTAPYSFINHMPLTEESARFEREVRNSKISGNLDNPEGTFDAMLQAVVCTKEIGWRDKARKILLVATDAGYHYAGDGKMAGIVQPNDGLCHLDSNGVYTEGTLQDFPSISQLKNKIRDESVNVLFAVPSFALQFYEELTRTIEGSHAGQLTQNSDNIVDLVKEQYKKISSSVELKDDAPKNVRVTYYTRCLKQSGKMEKARICKGLKVGDTVNYEVEIEVTSCPTNPKHRRQTFQISPIGLSETLVVDLELICECDCESPELQEINSGTCSGVGTYQCGVCSCPENRLGEFCQCDRQKAFNETDDTLCRKNNSSFVCSGRGECACGTCSCFRTSDGMMQPGDKPRRIYGTYCECDDFSCPRYLGKICGDHGECDCGRCICHSGWSGEACECSAHTSHCVGKHGEICGGKGICQCGECQCELTFGGPFCEDNIAPGGKCHDYRKCAQCEGFPKQARDHDCKSCNHSIIIVEELKEVPGYEHKCVFKDDDGCNFYFIYRVSDDGFEPLIRVQKERECPVPVNIPLVMSFVAGAVVALGLFLLLLWKLCTTVHDRREFAKFEKECLQAKWEKADNPIYKEAVTKFSNPMYSDTLEDE